MKRTIKICGGINEGVINTGAFQNLRPGFPLEETYTDVDMTDKEIQARQLQTLKTFCQEMHHKGKQLQLR